MAEINNFQRECIEAVLGALKSKGFPSCQFRQVVGKSETYQMASVTAREQLYKIYVYEDEAGLGIGREWFICEKPDFRSPQKLIQAFSRILSDKLPQLRK